MESIKSRMLFTSLLVLTLFMVLTAVALERAIKDRMLSAEEESLTAQLYSILAAVDRDSSGLSITVSENRLFESSLFDNESGLYAQLHDTKKEVWRSLSSVGDYPRVSDLKPEEMRFTQLKENSKQWFQLAFSIRWPDSHEKLQSYQLVIWKEAEDYFSQLQRFRQTLWVWLVISIILLLIIMWLVLWWNLKPLRQIGEEISAIEEGQKRHFGSLYPSELKPLTQNLNLLLTREQHQMQRYRNALDDLAHSLKTPLAVLHGLVSTDKWSEIDTETLKEQNQRMTQIVSYQLQKAAMLGGESIARPIDFSSLLTKTVNALKKVYQSKLIKIDLSVDDIGRVRIDESDLMEILGNLIDNACKYGDSQVKISVKSQNQMIVLTVEDNGAGLKKEQLDIILTRGTRLDQTQEGQGIGLAVVNEITKAYNIPMDFDESALGGLKVTLFFMTA